jgi:hypothetical protein
VRGTGCLYSLRVPENLESFLVMARTKKKGNGGKKSKATRNDVMQVGEASNAIQQPQQPTKVWQPGVDGMEDGEELQFDPTAYDCLHAFHLGWPCLRYEHFSFPGLEGLM